MDSGEVRTGEGELKLNSQRRSSTLVDLLMSLLGDSVGGLNDRNNIGKPATGFVACQMFSKILRAKCFAFNGGKQSDFGAWTILSY